MIGLVASHYSLLKFDFLNKKISNQISNCDENASVQKSIKEIERTVIDGVILNIDLSQKNIEINAMNFTSLNDLTKTKSVSENLIINIVDATDISSITRENDQKKIIKFEDLMVNDSVAVIISQNLIDSFLKENLVADVIKVIK